MNLHTQIVKFLLIRELELKNTNERNTLFFGERKCNNLEKNDTIPRLSDLEISRNKFPRANLPYDPPLESFAVAYYFRSDEGARENSNRTS